jgi:protein ImuA
MLLPFLPRDEGERGAMFQSIGPTWDGNETWLVVAAGATFAAAHGTPLLLLRASGTTGTSAAARRWRIAAAPAARDRFGSSAHWRWHATLERCRNGRPGQWLIEWTNDAHRFRLAEGVADCAPAAGAGLRRDG